MRHPLLPLLLASLVLAGAGCQRAADAAAEAAIERASGERVAVDRDGDRMRISTAEGEVIFATGEGMAFPSDFPCDLYLPPSYCVSSVMVKGGASLLILEANGSVGAMFDSAGETMVGKGWSQML